MLEKKEFNLDVSEQMNETVSRQDKNGNDVIILKHIPYAEKKKMAYELGEIALCGDEDTGICYVSALYEIALNYLFIKYYTNIDVSWVHEVTDYQKLYDYCTVNNFWYISICDEDSYLFMEYWKLYKDTVCRLFDARCSLGYTVKSLLSSDIDTTNPEHIKLIEKLIEINREEKRASLPISNNGVLNFAKRK